MKRDKSFGLDSVGSRLLDPAPSPRSRRSSPSPQVLLYAQNKAPGDWLPLTVITAPPDHLHHLALSCAKQPRTSGSTPVSATYSYRLYSYGRASNITHSRAQALKKKKVPFSPWVVCFSSFYMSLSEALLYKTDSYFRALNIFHTWLRGVFPPPPHTHTVSV